MNEKIVVRKCETLADLKRCCGLQRHIWKESDLDVEPVTIMVVAAHTGGHVLGAFQAMYGLFEIRCQCGDALDHVFADQYIQRCNTGGAGHRMRRVGVAVRELQHVVRAAL